MTADRLDLAGNARVEERQEDLLPAPARPSALRWTWLALVSVLLLVAGVAAAIVAALW